MHSSAQPGVQSRGFSTCRPSFRIGLGPAWPMFTLTELLLVWLPFEYNLQARAAWTRACSPTWRPSSPSRCC